MSILYRIHKWYASFTQHPFADTVIPCKLGGYHCWCMNPDPKPRVADAIDSAYAQPAVGCLNPVEMALNARAKKLSEK